MSPAPTDDPDIVPLTDDADCSSEILHQPVGYDGRTDYLLTFPWATTLDTLDTDGDPE